MNFLGFIFFVVYLSRGSGFILASLPLRPPLIDYDKANFHRVLEAAGKTVLRPGGSDASDKLRRWASDILTKDSHVVELACGLGNGGLSIAQTYGCHVLLTDLDDSRLELAKANAEKLGVNHLVDTRRVDMLHDVDKLGAFDCAIIEASLTHFERNKKRDILTGISRHAPVLLIHELCLVDCEEDSPNAKKLEHNMAKALRIGFFPETREGWEKLLQDAGYQVDHHIETRPLGMLKPVKILKDEGIAGFLKIVGNLVTNSELRARVKSTKKVIKENSKNLRYIIIMASKKNQT
jgi:SAM-dependent methyltransferase